VLGVAVIVPVRQSKCKKRTFIGQVWASLFSRSYCWLAPIECRSVRLNAGSLAVISGLRWPLVAVNSGWKKPLNAGRSVFDCRSLVRLEKSLL